MQKRQHNFDSREHSPRNYNKIITNSNEAEQKINNKS